jgi:hypothetical protein
VRLCLIHQTPGLPDKHYRDHNGNSASTGLELVRLTGVHPSGLPVPSRA